ncbi:hypothetical protein CHARACLAT_013841 [Characodon lateralis]|uniref:Uncharacterized protein n=1 Tax=Characodon lateralis TaxID=208331 RepID=A0ABU7CY33_9TELE|nr:hypothetical protein [Characodon lateralis]
MQRSRGYPFDLHMDDGASHSISKAESESADEDHFSHLYPGSGSLHSVGEHHCILPSDRTKTPENSASSA